MESVSQWDRRPSGSGAGQQNGIHQTLPSLANLTRGGQSASVSGHSPPLSHQSADLRDSGNWSLNSARASNISESSFSPQLTLPPIDPHALSTSHHTSPAVNQYNSLDNSALPTPSPSASRRSSFDSRLGNLQLSSPVNGTPAASQVSLASTLQRERGIHNGSPAINGTANDGSGGPGAPNQNNPFMNGRYSHGVPTVITGDGLGPNVSRSNSGPSRTAPPIIGAPRFPFGHSVGPIPHPNAPSPTKGFPYAFPDPDFAGPPSRDSSRMAPGRNSTNSLHGSATSSLYSGNSLHPGQHDHHAGSLHSAENAGGVGGPFGSNQHSPLYHNNPNDTNHLHHHHPMGGIRRPSLGFDASPPATPYSRTPELRVSHKLAERKRRKEMKDLFDELRDQLPAERGGKSSKWEVLTKAIEYIGQMKQTQDTLVRNQDAMQREIEGLRNEAQSGVALRQEIESLRMELQTVHQQGSQHAYHHNVNGGRMQGIERS